MSNTPSLVDVYHSAPPAAPHTGVMRVFINGFGHDLHFRPKAAPGTGLELQVDAVELQAAHLAALLHALEEEERSCAAIATTPGPAPTVQQIKYKAKSCLSTGALRLHGGTLQAMDLPWHEHVSRNGLFVLQLHRLTLDVPLLRAVLRELELAQSFLQRMRAHFQRAASNLLLNAALEDDAPP